MDKHIVPFGTHLQATPASGGATSGSQNFQHETHQQVELINNKKKN